MARKAKKQKIKKPTKALTVRKTEETAITIERMTDAKILEAFDLLGITPKLNDRTKRLFLEVARSNNLNPLKREIHAVERKQKIIEDGKETWISVLTPVTGYEVFIDRAEESGRLEYWYPQTKGKVEDSTLETTVTIKRRDWPKEFIWTVLYKEVRPENMDKAPLWKKEPHHMTEKVCISRAFRLCFRDILRGMPFTREEADTMPEMENRTERPPIAEPQEKTTEPPTVTGTVESDPALPTLEAVQLDCQALKVQMRESKKFSSDEIKDYTDACLEFGKDLKELLAIHKEWFEKILKRRNTKA